MKRSLPTRVAAAEKRAGIRRGLAMLTDDELVAAIAAMRRIEAATSSGMMPALGDRAHWHQADLLITEASPREMMCTRN